MTVVSDPAIIRHILVDNAANYRKDDLQLRILAPRPGQGPRDGRGRGMAAPAPHHRADLHAAPRGAASFRPWSRRPSALVRRWQRRPDGRVVDTSLEMTRVTLDVLERTIFTQGVPRDPDALGRAITRYFEAWDASIPLDIFGFPDWVPRIGRLRARPGDPLLRGDGRRADRAPARRSSPAGEPRRAIF